MLEPEIAELVLEDQINLFLINYRNNCLTSDGQFPSEKIFSFKPKMLIDLVNPKKSFKQQLLTQPNPPSDVSMPLRDRMIPNDPLDELMAGDYVWYKNHNPHHHAKWLKATFLKKFSINIFQVQTGSVQCMAHRTQLRTCRGDNSLARPNVLLSNEGVAKGVDSEDEDGFKGFPDEPAKSGMKRKRDANLANLSDGFLRRSKRPRAAKADRNFVYN